MKRARFLFMVAALATLTCCHVYAAENKDVPETPAEVTTEGKEEMKTEAAFEVVESELTIANGENEIYGKLYMPVTQEKVPAIILGHGYNGSHADWVKECTYYAQNGIAAYAYDFCGGSVNSKSTGETTDMTIWSEKSDVQAVFDEISAMDGIDKVFLMGGSQGGFATSLAAEEIGEKAAGMILYFPALCVPDDWRANYENESDIPDELDFWGMNLGKEFIVTVRQIDVFKEIGSFAQPVIIFHGTDDPIVPISYSQQAAELYPNATLITLEGEGHGFTPEAGEAVMKQVLEFMQGL